MNTSVIDQIVSPSTPKARAPKAPKAARPTIKASALTSRPKRIVDLVRARGVELDGVTLGADPEATVITMADQRIVSSIPILKRDKHNPIELGDGIRCYSDNTLLEMSFPSSHTKEQMVKTLRTAITRVKETLGDGYTIGTKAAHTYDADQLVPLYSIDPFLVGCTPSYCAYELTVDTPAEFNDGMRSSSFHLHFGHKHLVEPRNRFIAIKLMDIFVGCATVITDAYDETNVIRRLRYGKAGNHRMPSYGFEWRVLSGNTLRTAAAVTLVLDLTEHALDIMREGKHMELLTSTDSTKVRAAIDQCDAKLALEVLTAAQLPATLLKRVLAPHQEVTLAEGWNL